MGSAFKNPRTIRLGRELEDMKSLKRDSSIFDFEAFGDPPEKYILTFKGKTLVPIERGETFPSESAEISDAQVGGPQQVEINLGGDYPRHQPQVRWMTPILHPNIWGHGTVCLGNYGGQWTPYFKLVDMVEILWDMARLAVLNPRSAGTGGRNAEQVWEKLHQKFKFPVDKRPLRNKALSNDEGSSVVRPGGDENDIVIMPDDGDNCPVE